MANRGRSRPCSRCWSGSSRTGKPMTEPGLYEEIESGVMGCRVCSEQWPSGDDERHDITCVAFRLARAEARNAELLAACEAAQTTLSALVASHEAEPFREHLDPMQRFQ